MSFLKSLKEISVLMFYIFAIGGIVYGAIFYLTNNIPISAICGVIGIIFLIIFALYKEVDDIKIVIEFDKLKEKRK